MEHFDLILTLTGGLTAALFFGYLAFQFKLSPIVGYLIAGIVVGPATPGFVGNQEIASELAEVGVILMMFGVGLHFNLNELIQVRAIAIPGAIGQILAATLIGIVAFVLMGFSSLTGLVFGLSISIASTVVLLRTLSDNNEMDTSNGHIAIGWLLVEDLCTVLMLVLLPILLGKSNSGPIAIVLSLFWSIIKLALLILVTIFGGQRAIPWFLAKIEKTGSRELFTLSVLVMALGIAVGSAEMFGASMALGAFLAGMAVGRSEFSHRAATEALPMRDAFAVLFFVSVGMMFDPYVFIQSPVMVFVALGIVVVGKPLSAFAIIRAFGHPVKTGLIVAVSLAQIGEFSFILARLGEDLALIDKQAFNVLVATAILSITVNPILYRMVPQIEGWINQTPFLQRV